MAISAYNSPLVLPHTAGTRMPSYISASGVRAIPAGRAPASTLSLVASSGSASPSPEPRILVETRCRLSPDEMRLILGVVCAIAVCSAELQNITITGQLLCQGKYVPNARVQLMERDKLDPDDELASIYSDEFGKFTLFGDEDEVGWIEPYIRLTHRCLAKRNCQRVGIYNVPRDNVGGTYDMTLVTLDIVVDGESEECL